VAATALAVAATTAKAFDAPLYRLAHTLAE
jgi:hypothetical protein